MFIPAIPLGGYAGWKIFERTADRQFAAFSRTPEFQRSIAYFRAKIADVASAADLVADRRLLSVALGAFGLESEISKRAIVRRVLEEPANKPDSFANRLNDPRWRAFARAFSFGDGAPRFQTVAGREEIAASYAERAFEGAVGDVDADVRLALNFRREIRSIAQSDSADRVGWFQILGQQPLRRVVEAAFGLPGSLAQLDIDRQRSILEGKAEAFFGTKSPAAFRNPENIEIALRRFFASQAAQQNGIQATGRGAAALAILSGATGASPAGLLNSNALI